MVCGERLVEDLREEAKPDDRTDEEHAKGQEVPARDRGEYRPVHSHQDKQERP